MKKDPYRYFRVEAREIIEQLTRGLLELEGGNRSAQARVLMRLAHTLKGAARVVRLASIADLAHEMEDRLVLLCDADAKVQRGHVDAILEMVTRLRELVEGLDAPAEGNVATGRSSIPVAYPLGRRADALELDHLEQALVHAANVLVTVRQNLDAARGARTQLERLSTTLRAPPPNSQAQERSSAQSLGSLDDAARSLHALERTLEWGVDHLETELNSAHRAAQRLRLVSLSDALIGLERAVRDDASALGKRLRIETSGLQLPIDERIATSLHAALVQFVRNAVAHGIETEAERKARNKPVEGVIRIELSRQGSSLRLACWDDGRGIDGEALRQRVAPGSGAGDDLTDEKLIELLLVGGLTTADRLSAFAGRGIGLDVVRDAVERVRGRVSVHTRRGQGTRFEITVPAVLSAVQLLLVLCGDVIAAIPHETVVTALPRARRAVTGGEIQHDGELLPVMRAASILDGGRSHDGNDNTFLILETGKGRVALEVDRVLRMETLLVRPVPDLAFAKPFVSGIALDEAGQLVPLLDPSRLDAAPSLPPTLSPTHRRRPILVIDDSLTTRMLEQSILESAGYEVDLATHAEEGLRKAKSRQYGLFLVDVEMPGMNGFEFVEQTRADPALSEVPAILVTSRNSSEDRQRGQSAGASDYIVKSEFDQERLLRRVNELMGDG